jgi:hypothetical protein
MGAKNDNGLTARQARFAAFLAEGHNQADAYRKAYRAKNMKPETIWSEASRHDRPATGPPWPRCTG